MADRVMSIQKTKVNKGDPMKPTAYILAAVLGAALSVSSLALAKDSQDQSQGASDSQDMGGSSGGTIIRGKAVSVDPQSKKITVTDYVSGGDRTFAVSRSKDLDGIKPGDNVDVTPDKSNVSAAQKVEKDKDSSRP
jgi:hypothetical protein